jgi:transglutaminase-like putative cysteine protease
MPRLRDCGRSDLQKKLRTLRQHAPLKPPRLSPKTAANPALDLALYSIRHRTEYQYRKPVRLGPHRLMLRPRESRDVRLISNEITAWPPATLSWAQDVFGNAIATATFADETKSLIIESVSSLELTSLPWPIFPVAACASQFPFTYSPDERADLGALLIPQHLDEMGRLSAWATSFIRSNPTDTLALLKDVNAGISGTASYQQRDGGCAQAPTRTLDLGYGSCRDFAVLFVETARTLGFGARIVSGYLFNPFQQGVGGTTHAWAEVFVPGAGWISFDPTHRQTGSFNLIPVAVARDLQQAMPVSGTYTGVEQDALRLMVDVRVREGA